MTNPHRNHISESVRDSDGRIYRVNQAGSLVRESPKMRGKDRRLARSIARMMEKEQ